MRGEGHFKVLMRNIIVSNQRRCYNAIKCKINYIWIVNSSVTWMSTK